MYLATFVVSIMDTDPETGRIDVSHVEVGSTEINRVDVLAALKEAREQASLIVDGLKTAFPGLTRQDVQIHIRPATIQLMLDPEWKYMLGKRKTISGYMEEGVFIYDPKNQLVSMNTSTKPKPGPGTPLTFQNYYNVQQH